MSELTQKGIQAFFRKAKEAGHEYIAVAFSLPGTPKPEIQINPAENYDAKQRFFAVRYDDNLCARHNPELRVINYASGNSFKEVEHLITSE